MKFGVVLGNDPTTTVAEVRLLEERGFETAWFPEMPLLGYGDPFVCMTIAAQATEKLRLGTFVAAAGIRLAPTLLTPIGTVARLAPGRIRLGWGSGSASHARLGRPPLKFAEFSEELRVLRDLLDTGETRFEGRSIRFSAWNRYSLNLEGIPLEVAASGPRTAALAGELGDGLLGSGEFSPERLGALRDAAGAAAAKVGRALGEFSYSVDLGPLCVLRKGEALDSARVADAVQPRVTSHHANLLVAGTDPDELPSDQRDGYVGYRAWVFDRCGADPEIIEHFVWDRSGARIPEHDQFLSASAIEACTMTGPLEQIASTLTEMKRRGVKEVMTSRNLDRPFAEGDSLSDLLALRELVG